MKGKELDEAEVVQAQAEGEETPVRRERIPLGTPRAKLSIPKAMQDYFEQREEVPRWINDDPGRLEAATQEDSYRFVMKREFPNLGYGAQIGQDLDAATMRDGIDDRISRIVGTREAGAPITAYLMAKPRKDYEADQRTKMNIVDEREKAMLQGIDSRGRPGDKEGRYIPSPGIKITRS